MPALVYRSLVIRPARENTTVGPACHPAPSRDRSGGPESVRPHTREHRLCAAGGPCRFNIPSRDFGDAAHGGNDTLGCAAAVEDAALEMAAHPAFYCNNDGWPNATDGGAGWAAHNISLAAYLVAAAEPSYFSSGLHWTDLIPGTQLRAWPAWPDFRRPLGRPSGPRVRDGFVFRRTFEHADVTLDCGTVTARIHWRRAVQRRAGLLSGALAAGKSPL